MRDNFTWHQREMNTIDLKELDFLRTKMVSDYKKVRKTANKPFRSTLMIAMSRGRYRFYAVAEKDGKRVKHIIDGDKGRIYRLAHRAYMKELANRLQRNCALLDRAIERMLPTDYLDILKSLPKNYDLLDPSRVLRPEAFEDEYAYPNPSRNEFPVEARLSIGNLDPYEWAARLYCENTKHSEHKIHLTRRSILCRSKSEALLFEIYDSLEIPFHYDEVITIGSQPISPDFIGVRRDGALIFHEHVGRFDEEYRSSNDWKPGLYAVAGICPGVNLIYTYDNVAGALNVNLARELIKDIYWL